MTHLKKEFINIFAIILLNTTSLLFFGQIGCINANTVYKSQDNHGKTIYSDQPMPNSQAITLPKTPEPQTPEPIAPITTQPPHLQPPTPSAPPANIKHYKVVMMHPKTEAVFTNEINEIEVKLFLEPDLHPNDRIQLKSNGQALGGFQESTTFQIQRLPRGQYDLQAFIINKSGKGKPKGQTEIVRIHQIRNHVAR